MRWFKGLQTTELSIKRTLLSTLTRLIYTLALRTQLLMPQGRSIQTSLVAVTVTPSLPLRRMLPPVTIIETPFPSPTNLRTANKLTQEDLTAAQDLAQQLNMVWTLRCWPQVVWQQFITFKTTLTFISRCPSRLLCQRMVMAISSMMGARRAWLWTNDQTSILAVQRPKIKIVHKMWKAGQTKTDSIPHPKMTTMELNSWIRPVTNLPKQQKLRNSIWKLWQGATTRTILEVLLMWVQILSSQATTESISKTLILPRLVSHTPEI